MTNREKEITKELGHPVFTQQFLEQCIINDFPADDNLSMQAKGYYQCIQRLAKKKKIPHRMISNKHLKVIADAFDDVYMHAVTKEEKQLTLEIMQAFRDAVD